MTVAAPFTLRAARPADGEAVARMCTALSRHEGSAEPALTASRFRRDGFTAGPGFRCILAEMDGAPAGYAMYVPDYDTDLLCHSAYVADLYVDNGARRCGIGKALMAAVARTARGWGARTLCWNVVRSNHTARAFYRRMGRELADALLCGVENAAFDRLAATPAPAQSAIRRAGPADAGALALLLRMLQSSEGIEPPVRDVAAVLAADGFGPSPAFTCHLAERGGDPLGYVLHWPTYDTGSAARGTHLSDIYVVPQKRRRGTARALMAAAARHGAHQARYMEWRLRRDNAAARAFYATFAEEYPEVLPMIAVGDAFAALAAAGMTVD